jgi:tetratricopeptide (TPR) repeat protein
LDDSINSYKRAIKLKPNYVDAYSNMGEALQASGRFKEAIKSCQQAIKIDPNCSGAYYNLGNSFSPSIFTAPCLIIRNASEVELTRLESLRRLATLIPLEKENSSISSGIWFFANLSIKFCCALSA